MAALMAAASIWVSTLLTMSIFATILPHMRYTSMLVVEPMFQKAAAIIGGGIIVIGLLMATNVLNSKGKTAFPAAKDMWT